MRADVAAGLPRTLFLAVLVPLPPVKMFSQPAANFSVLPVFKTVTMIHLYANVLSARSMSCCRGRSRACRSGQLSFHDLYLYYTTAARPSTQQSRAAMYSASRAMPTCVPRLRPQWAKSPRHPGQSPTQRKRNDAKAQGCKACQAGATVRRSNIALRPGVLATLRCFLLERLGKGARCSEFGCVHRPRCVISVPSVAQKCASLGKPRATPARAPEGRAGVRIACRRCANPWQRPPNGHKPTANGP